MENTANPLAIRTSEIIVDGSTVNENPAAAFRGLGCMTGGGSSRLLLDYKANAPEAYDEILRQLFAPAYGAGLTYIKVELGADVRSGAGVEPCVKRTADETPDVTRSAGFLLAADAKRINPNVNAGLVQRDEPQWVTAAFKESREAGFAARYRLFYETLVAAYITYGLTFDYISPDTKQVDADWLVYFAEKLRGQENPPYDFSAIQLVASDAAGGNADAAVKLLIAEKLEDLVAIQVEAIKNIKIDKVTVWDSGQNADGQNSTAGFISGMMKAVPPLNELFKQAGMELPELLGKDITEVETPEEAPQFVETVAAEPTEE